MKMFLILSLLVGFFSVELFGQLADEKHKVIFGKRANNPAGFSYHKTSYIARSKAVCIRTTGITSECQMPLSCQGEQLWPTASAFQRYKKHMQSSGNFILIVTADNRERKLCTFYQKR